MASRADLMLEALQAQYGTGGDLKTVNDYLERYFQDNSDARPYEGQNWYDHITTKGAVGTTHSDRDLDFWTRQLNLLP